LKNSGVLITGGAGFIGCEMSKALRESFGRVVAFDNLHPQIHPSCERPDALPAHVELKIADVRDAASWAELFQDFRPSIVIHLAAETGTGQSLVESTRHASVNVVGTAEMLDAFSNIGFKPDHILLASSRAVYGEGAWTSNDKHAFYPLRRSNAQLSSGAWGFENAQGKSASPLAHRAASVMPNPSSIYGATKLAQENILSAWTSAMGVPLSILRFQNVYGPGQSPFNAYTGIITLFHRQAHAGKTIEVYEDGNIGRDFVLVSDVVDVCIAALKRIPTGVRILDVGMGKVTTILEAAKIVARIHNAPEPKICGKFRDGDIRWAVSDMQDTTAELGVTPRIDFEKGCRMVGEWLVERGYM
jgi:dTDP-L-rhamnose 4-epimerase